MKLNRITQYKIKQIKEQIRTNNIKQIKIIKAHNEKIKIKTAGGVIKVKNFDQQFYKSIKSKDDLNPFL